MKFLGFEEAKSELVRLKKENEDLSYKLYWSKEAYKRLNEENEDLKRQIKYSKEHKCTPECFDKHVIKAIQNDYDSIDSKNRMAKYYFLQYWFEKLTKEYTWLKCLQIIDDKIYFK